jgi:hypothetical protein
MSGSNKKKKTKRNKTSTGSMSLTSSTDRCTSPENNEAVEMLDTTSTDRDLETEPEIDGYLLSKMLNIPCPEGEKIINSQGIKDSGVASSILSPLDVLDAYDKFEDVVPQQRVERKKKEPARQMTEEEGDWVLSGGNVVEICDQPADCDITLLQDLVAAYGRILESDMISKEATLSVRYK